MDENEQDSFGFDSSDLSNHEQALIDAVNQGKNLSQAKGSSGGGSFPSSVQKSKRKGNLFGSLVSSFSKNAAAFMKDDSGGNSGTSSSLAMLDKTSDTGNRSGITTKRPGVVNRAAGVSGDISGDVKKLSGVNSTTNMTPFQRQELLILNRIKDDVSEIADLLKDLDGKPSTKGTTELIKGKKEGKEKSNMLGDILALGAGLAALLAGALNSFLKGFKWPELKWPKFEFPKFEWPKMPELNWPKFEWPKLPWDKSGAPTTSGTPNGSKKPSFRNPFRKNYQPKHMAAPRPSRFKTALGTVGRKIGGASKAVGRGISKTAKITGKVIGTTARMTGKAIGATARVGVGAAKLGFKLSGLSSAWKGLSKIGGGLGRAAMVAGGVVDVVNNYNEMQKHKDRGHQIGGAINMGMDVIGSAALASSKVGFLPGAVIATAAHMVKTVNTGYMGGPKGRQLEAGIAAYGNEEDDAVERFKNLGKIDKSKAFWDPGHYGFETNSERRDGLVAELANKHDDKSLARVKQLKSLQLKNKKTYKDYDYNAGNIWNNISGVFTGSADQNFGNVFHNIGNMVGPHLPKMPGTPQLQHIPSLPNAGSILKNTENAVSRAITTISAPLTQNINLAFNNAVIQSKDDVRKWINEALKAQMQAQQMADRAREGFSNISNTIKPSAGIAILPSSAMMG